MGLKNTGEHLCVVCTLATMNRGIAPSESGVRSPELPFGSHQRLGICGLASVDFSQKPASSSAVIPHPPSFQTLPATRASYHLATGTLEREASLDGVAFAAKVATL